MTFLLFGAITMYDKFYSSTFAGASDGWAKDAGIKYSYTIELRDKGEHGFILH